MSDPVARLAAAEVEAARARADFHATIDLLHVRLEPHRLARDARQGLSEVGGVAVAQVRDAVVRRPGIVAGAVAAVGLFAARRRLAGLFRRKATAPDDAS